MKRCVGEHVSPTREKGKGKGARRRPSWMGLALWGRCCRKEEEREATAILVGCRKGNCDGVLSGGMLR